MKILIGSMSSFTHVYAEELQDGLSVIALGPILKAIAKMSGKPLDQTVEEAKVFFMNKVLFCESDLVKLLKITDQDQGKMARLMIQFHISQVGKENN